MGDKYKNKNASKTSKLETWHFKLHQGTLEDKEIEHILKVEENQQQQQKRWYSK